MNGEPMLTSKRYDVTIRKLIDLIFKMTADERGLLLNEAERIKTKLRATRKRCNLPILLYYAEGVYPASITNLSFTGAFVECRIPVIVGDPATLKFKNSNGLWDLTMEARIVHATSWGIGLRFKTVGSRAARFLQKCLDDFKQ
jgi:hypothetical protein